MSLCCLNSFKRKAYSFGWLLLKMVDFAELGTILPKEVDFMVVNQFCINLQMFRMSKIPTKISDKKCSATFLE